MKKYLVLFICLILSGCKETETIIEDKEYTLNHNGGYYQIYVPYKAGVGEKYFITDSNNQYDVDYIEKGLLDLSSEHFSPSELYYQEGQYLKKKDLSNLLSKDKLNKANKITEDGVSFVPNYIVSIYEENFLDSKGKIQGVSLGIVVNRHQTYKNKSKKIVTKTISEEKVIAHVKEQVPVLIEQIRKKSGLENVEVLVAIYIESAPNSAVSGNYRYYGITENNDVNWKNLNNSKHYVNSVSAKNLDSNSYNDYQLFESKVKKTMSDLYISSMGYYQSNKLTKLDIRITRSSYSYGELLLLGNVVSENIMKYLGNSEVIVEIREINEIKAYISKAANAQTVDVFIY
jgi:Protein involved in sex pheromone biosynthesis